MFYVSLCCCLFIDCLNFVAATRKFVESKLQSLDPQAGGIDSYLRTLETAKERRDYHKRSAPIVLFSVHINVVFLVSIATLLCFSHAASSTLLRA